MLFETFFLSGMVLKLSIVASIYVGIYWNFIGIDIKFVFYWSLTKNMPYYY